MKKFTNENFRTIVAVDTNMFFNIVSSNENYVPKKGDRHGFYDTIRSIKKKCINGSLRIVILPQVWEEIKDNLDNREKEFLSEYCFFIEPKDSVKFATKTAKLVYNYIKSGVMEDENGNKTATSDSIIMAQSSVAGLNLITCNHKHFLYYKHGTKHNKREIKRDRADDIQEINSKHGYYFEMKNGKSFVPRPCSPAEYFELYKDGNFYELSEYENVDLIQKEM